MPGVPPLSSGSSSEAMGCPDRDIKKTIRACDLSICRSVIALRQPIVAVSRNIDLMQTPGRAAKRAACIAVKLLEV
jgi:hypothetical protein